MITLPDVLASPAPLLPSAGAIRERLAHAQRDVEILRGLLRLSESVARRDGRPVDGGVSERRGGNDVR